MGGGGQYPFPKEVWSPAGGWWGQPKNWKANTAVATGIILFAAALTWRASAKLERRHNEPTHWIPSMMWSKQFKDGELGVRKDP